MNTNKDEKYMKDTNNAFTYRIQETEQTVGNEDITKTNMKIYNSPQYGVRIDLHQDESVTQSTYSLLDEKAIIVVMYQLKKYAKHPLTDGALTGMKTSNPMNMIHLFKSVEYKELDSDSIEGINVKGIEINDPSVVDLAESLVGRLWIDVETELPVQVEFEIVLRKGDTLKEIKTIMNNFHWNVDLDKSEFSPDIPEDYELVEAKIF